MPEKGAAALASAETAALPMRPINGLGAHDAFAKLVAAHSRLHRLSRSIDPATEAVVALDNAVLTPHIAGGTRETWDAFYAGVIANIDSFLRTGRPAMPVDLAESAQQ